MKLIYLILLQKKLTVIGLFLAGPHKYQKIYLVWI